MIEKRLYTVLLSTRAILIEKFHTVLWQINTRSIMNNYLIFVILLSVFLRTWQFSEIPQGLNQDEVSAAYEAWSLLETGKDRWGNQLPIYFPAWGSGQNVLYSYSCIPFYFLLGVSEFSFRLPNLLMGIASIFLLFSLFKDDNKWKGLIAVCVLGLSPWHIVLSRWALEVNMLPFWLILHFFLLKKTWQQNTPLIWLSFIPLVFASYTYAIVFFSLPIYFFLLLTTFREIRVSQKIAGFLLYVVFTLPLLLFVLKPYFAFIPSQFLWFSLPDLASSRVDFSESWKSVMHTNLQFVFKGFHDGTTWNTTLDTMPHSSLVLFGSALGLVYSMIRIKEGVLNKVWVISCIAAVVPFIFFRMNLNRSLYLQTIIIILAVQGLFFMIDTVKEQKNKKIIAIALIALLLINTSWFSIDYFRFYPLKTKEGFQTGLSEAIKTASNMDKQVYVTSSIPFPYLYTAFYLRISPEEFQEQDFYIEEGRYQIKELRNFQFHYSETAFRNEIDKVHRSPQIFLARKQEVETLTGVTYLYKSPYWVVFDVK